MPKPRTKKGPHRQPKKMTATLRTHELLGLVHGVTMMNQTVCSYLYFEQVMKAYPQEEVMDDGETPVLEISYTPPENVMALPGGRPQIPNETVLGTLFGTQEFVYSNHFPMTADAWNRHRSSVVNGS